MPRMLRGREVPVVTACLSFYDEPVEALLAYVASCHLVGIEHIVAVDGAYAQYPGGRPRSPSTQHAALCEAAGAFGLGASLVLPERLWDSEMQKRTAMFRYALAACPTGWFFSMDADEHFASVDSLPDLLTDVREDTAEVTVRDMMAVESGDPDWKPDFIQRRLFRAQPIEVHVNHYTYVASDGRVLWSAGGSDEVDAVVLPDVLIEHRPRRPDPARQLAKQQLYATREETQIERGACDRCHSKSAVVKMPLRWQFTRDGRPVSKLGELCAPCAKTVDRVNKIKLRQRGINPDNMPISERYGALPV